jgi:hydrogenase-1 operon protein HyaE
MSHDTAHPLQQRLVRQFGARWITPETLDAFLAEPGDRVLFLSGDPVRFPEALDVAVVLPELQAAHPGRFAVGVVDREHETEIARRFGSNRWPALVFLRDGAYVTVLPGMHDWTEYVTKVGEALDAPTSRAPTIGIPVVSANADAGATAANACH